MRKLLLFVLAFQLLGQTFCKSNKGSNKHGFDEITTLVKLQNSNSIEVVKDYLSKFEGWELALGNDSRGGMWLYKPNDAGAKYHEEPSLSTSAEGAEFSLTLQIHDAKLLNQYLYQISQDNAYVLQQKSKIGDVTTYEGHGCYLEFIKLNSESTTIIVYPAKNSNRKDPYPGK